MNQIFLTGRIAATEKTAKGENLLVSIYHYGDDEYGVEQIPVEINDKSAVYIGKIMRGDLVAIIGKLIFEDNKLKIAVDKINYAG